MHELCVDSVPSLIYMVNPLNSVCSDKRLETSATQKNLTDEKHSISNPVDKNPYSVQFSAHQCKKNIFFKTILPLNSRLVGRKAAIFVSRT